MAAADVTESLILQIERSGECAAKPAALHIVRNALDSIDGNRSQTPARIKTPAQTDGGTLEAALGIIASLNPFHRRFASSTPKSYSDEALANLLAFRGIGFPAAPLPNTENPLRFRQHTNAKPQNNYRIIL